MWFDNKIIEIKTSKHSDAFIDIFKFCFTAKKWKLERLGRLWTLTERKALQCYTSETNTK